MPWQHRIADVIVETERELPAKHLIAQNIANKSAQIADPHPAVSIFNFHYASPPETVAMNYGLNKAIGDDETGFRGVSDDVYRMEGLGFRHRRRRALQQSRLLVRRRLRGRDVRYPASQPGGGSRALRRQLKILAEFIGGFDFLRMAPDNAVITKGAPPGGTARALVERGRAMAIYLRKKRASSGSAKEEPPAADAGPSEPLRLDLPEGQWRAEWVDPMTGAIVSTADIRGGGVRALTIPDYALDIALRLRRIPQVAR